MDDVWIARRGKKRGPYTVDQVFEAAAAGRLSSSDSLWWPGMRQWVPYEEALVALKQRINPRRKVVLTSNNVAVHTSLPEPTRLSPVPPPRPSPQSASKPEPKPRLQPVRSASTTPAPVATVERDPAPNLPAGGLIASPRRISRGRIVSLLASITLGSLFAMRNDLSVVEALATCAIVFILIVWLPKVLTA